MGFDIERDRNVHNASAPSFGPDAEGHGFTKLENRIEAYRHIGDVLPEYVDD